MLRHPALFLVAAMVGAGVVTWSVTGGPAIEAPPGACEPDGETTTRGALVGSVGGHLTASRAVDLGERVATALAALPGADVADLRCEEAQCVVVVEQGVETGGAGERAAADVVSTTTGREGREFAPHPDRAVAWDGLDARLRAVLSARPAPRGTAAPTRPSRR